MAETWITTAEACELSGYTPDHLRTLIRSGKIKARKISIVWLVEKASLMAYIRTMGQLGEKRGPKKE